MSHKTLLKVASAAIEELFSDTSVNIHKTLDSMEELRGDIDMKIAALKADIKQGRGGSDGGKKG